MNVKELYDDIMTTMARLNLPAYFLAKNLRVVYVDEMNNEKIAETDGREIILYRNWTELDDRDRYVVVLHELYHVLMKHPVRGASILEKYIRPGMTVKEIENLKRLLNIVMDCKVDYFIRKKKIDSKILLRLWIFSDEMLEKCSVEELFEYLLDKEFNREATSGISRIGDDIPMDGCGCGNNTEGEVLNEGNGNLINASEDELESELDKVIRDSMLSAKNAGANLTGIEEIVIDELLKPKVDWRVLLRHCMHNSMAKNYVCTWVKMNRRLPELAGYKVITKPVVWVFVDVSGSITSQEFAQFMTEVMSMIQHASKIMLITWDTIATGEYELKTAANVKTIRFRGGGGTRFAPVLRRYESKIRPDGLMVVLTDGEWFDIDEAVNMLRKIRANKILVTTGRAVEGFDAVIEVR